MIGPAAERKIPLFIRLDREVKSRERDPIGRIEELDQAVAAKMFRRMEGLDADLLAKTLLGVDAGFEHYRVKEYPDGTVVLQPRVLVSPNALTAKTLRDSEAGHDVRTFETSAELLADLES